MDFTRWQWYQNKTQHTKMHIYIYIYINKNVTVRLFLIENLRK
jgi:hypothetical protein